MKLKKLTALAMTTAMCAATVFGCGGSEGNNGETGLIKVKGWMEDELIYISVEDNSVGMDEEKAATIITRDSKGYGIRNVNERIQLYYGEQYHLSVQSKLNKGTRITVCIPAKEM